jgi:hypothetical protein
MDVLRTTRTVHLQSLAASTGPTVALRTVSFLTAAALSSWIDSHRRAYIQLLLRRLRFAKDVPGVRGNMAASAALGVAVHNPTGRWRRRWGMSPGPSAPQCTAPPAFAPASAVCHVQVRNTYTVPECGAGAPARRASPTRPRCPPSTPHHARVLPSAGARAARQNARLRSFVGSGHCLRSIANATSRHPPSQLMIGMSASVNRLGDARSPGWSSFRAQPKRAPCRRSSLVVA